MLEGQIALVSGASRGIGQAIALALGKQGATVVGTATSPSGAEAISTYLKDAGINGVGLALNVNDAAQIEQCLQTVQKQFGDIAILVNNAGVTRDNLLMRMKEEEWQAVIDTNLSAVFLTCKTFMRGMLKARHGRIINISSVVGVMGNAGQTNYAAAKAGMIGFSKAMAREVASRGITVNVIAPGFISTDMTAGLAEAQRQELEARVPLQRLGTVEDVAAAALFLAGRSGSYVTGETLHVNGGMVMS